MTGAAVLGASRARRRRHGAHRTGRGAGRSGATRRAPGRLRRRGILIVSRVASGARGDPRIVRVPRRVRRCGDARPPPVRALNLPRARRPAVPRRPPHARDRHASVRSPNALASPVPARCSLHAAVRAADLAATLTWPGTWRMARRWWRTGAERSGWPPAAARWRTALRATCPRSPPATCCPAAPACVRRRSRATGRWSTTSPYPSEGPALHVRNAPSPAATSALALARHIADQLAG